MSKLNTYKWIRFVIVSIVFCVTSCEVQQAALPKNQRPIACFTPQQKCYPQIVRCIEAAQQTILVRAYSFTSQEIADALIKAHQRGLKVLVLSDKVQMKGSYSLINKLIDAGIPVKREKCKGLAHNKVIIIDNVILITGSYNFTKGAESRNAENLLILRQGTLLKKYLLDWQVAWEKS